MLYQTEDGRSRVECRFVDNSLWLSQAQMVELFQSSKQNISLHVKNVLAEGELQAAATVKEYLTVQTEGVRTVRRKVHLYNLDMILAVGYRVKSPRGTQFRRWATERLGEYLLKGFTMDDERLKNPPVGDSAVPDRFGELLERIRDIRASERRMYLRVRATLTQASPTGDALLAQRSIVLQRPAPSADAAGGAQALRLATDAAAQELAQWLAQLGH